MRAILLPFLILLALPGDLFAQSVSYERHLQAIEEVVTGYSLQDFGRMKKPWGILGKVIIREKALEREYGPFFAKYGPATIDTVIFESIYTGTAQLRFTSHPKKRSFFRFNFNEKGKIQGFGWGYPTFVYRARDTDIAKAPRSAEEKYSTIDSIVRRYARPAPPRNFNGCLLVTDGEDILYQGCEGLARWEPEQALNDSSMFLLASCSKQFTAVAIMMLEEEGLVEYDQLVKQYLPDFPYPGVTIEHLLTHTSGIPDYFPLMAKHWDASKFATNQDILNLLSERKPKAFFEPNEAFSYSNTGYTMLSLIIEKVSGMSYGEFITTHIIEPLEMPHTAVVARRSSGQVPDNYAWGHVYSRESGSYVLPDSLESYQYVHYLDAITGDDGVSSSLLDLHRWNQALRNHELVSQTSMARAYGPHRLADGVETDYGYGFLLKNGAGIEPMIYHTGGWPGYSTMILNLPEQELSVILLSNNGYESFSFLVDEIVAFLLEG